MPNGVTIPFLDDETPERIRADLDAGMAPYSIAEGSWADLLNGATSLVLYDIGVVGNLAILQRMFLTNPDGSQAVFGEDLDALGANYGVERKDPSVSLGALTFTGTALSTIPAGTHVETAGTDTTPAVVVETLADATILAGHTTVDVAAQALTAGAAGNVSAHTLTLLSSPVAGIESVDNAVPFTGGADSEADPTYWARVVQRARAKPGKANVDYYVGAIAALDGVGEVEVTRTPDGPGTVQAVFLDPEGSIPNGDLVDAVDLAVNGTTPGDGNAIAAPSAIVTVLAPSTFSVDVSLPGLEADTAAGYTTTQARANATAAVTSLILATPIGGLLRVMDLIRQVSEAAGVRNFRVADARLNGAGTDLQLSATQKAVVGTISFPA